MTFHRTRAKRATGSKAKTPSISVSLPPDDMAVLTWWAGVKKIPAAQVLRDAVHSYFLPFKNNPQLKRQYGSEP